MSKKAGVKSKEKYELQLKNELSLLVRTSFKDPRIHLTSITRAELNKDYSVAKIYWDSFDPNIREAAQTTFEELTGKFRTALAKNLPLKQIPKLIFLYDTQYDDEKHIEDLVK
jgi:ribosome-binding factor A